MAVLLMLPLSVGTAAQTRFSFTYNGQQGEGAELSEYARAAFQSALYLAARHNPLLASYPVFGVSETGAETDNVGLQYRMIPAGEAAVFPAVPGSPTR